MYTIFDGSRQTWIDHLIPRIDEHLELGQLELVPKQSLRHHRHCVAAFTNSSRHGTTPRREINYC